MQPLLELLTLQDIVGSYGQLVVLDVFSSCCAASCGHYQCALAGASTQYLCYS